MKYMFLNEIQKGKLIEKIYYYQRVEVLYV